VHPMDCKSAIVCDTTALQHLQSLGLSK